MIRHFRPSIRHLMSQKVNSLVHITGLALGMTVCLLIGLFIRYETSFDRYQPFADRTYRINQIWTDNGKSSPYFATPLPMAATLRQSAAGLDHVAFAHPAYRPLIDVAPDKRFEESHVMFTDPEFLNVFHVEAVKGDPYDVLRRPYQALLTESIATKFFGSEDPIGKTFKFNSKFDITVGGVIRDLPGNTHLPATIILSYVPNQDYVDNGPDAWSYTSGTSAYVVVPEGYDLANLQAQLDRIADEHINSDPHLPKFVRAGFDIQPMSNIHFNMANSGSQWVPAINVSWLWFFGAIGIAVLALACINFVNLSTAQALARAREVGVRKAVGAGRSTLLFQFLSEAWLLAGIAGVIAVGAAELALPSMNTLLEKRITFEIMNSVGILAVLAIGIFATGLLAGLYPAWIITRFNAATSLRSSFSTQGDSGSSWLRHSLVVVQFVISAGLLISLLLISEQVNFIRNKDLGFNKDNIIMVRSGSRGESPAFNAELDKIPQVESWSYSTASPSSDQHWSTVMSKESREDPSRQPVMLVLGDENFCKLYNFKLLAGRFPIAADTNLISERLPQEKMLMKAVVNAKLVETLGFGTPEEAVGRKFWFGMGNGDIEVVGVVANFNTSSLHEDIKPTIIGQERSTYNTVGIRLHPGANIPATIAAINQAWTKAYPDGLFSYHFLDEQIGAFYQAEERIYQLFKVFSGMAMLISCLGLWGLITFAAQRRLKEIGIRKVLGASSSSVVFLLSRQFIALVMIALVVATPIVFYGISEWLSAFAFRVPIGWKPFALAGGTSMLLALLTVGVQALKAAWMNPASVLKTE